MTLQELKNNLLENHFPNQAFIFKYDDNTFLVKDYINKIQEITNLTINYLNSVDDLIALTNDAFFDYSEQLNILFLEKLTQNIPNNLVNCIIVCQNIEKDIKENLKEYIIEFPKLEDWQIDDYANIRLDGVNTNAISWLCNVSQHNIFRLDNEIQKIEIFDKKDRNNIFNLINSDNGYSDLNNFNIFNLINGIVKKDKKSVCDILSVIDTLDIEPMGLITLLIKQFKNVIDIQLGNNPTPTKLGVSQKQFNAIKYNCGKYTSNQLLDIFSLLTSIDFKLKSGILENDRIIDYTICNIFK